MKSDTKVWPQYLLAFVCNLGTLAFGVHIGWLSPIQLRLQSNSTPLAPDVPPLTLEEVSWIGALPTVTLIIGPFIFGYLLEKLGRKLSLLLVIIPNILSYLCLMFAKSVNTLYIGRLLSGLAACIFVITPIYVNESVDDNIRGILGSFSGLSINLGIFLGFIFGGFTDYLTLNLVGLFFPSLFLFFYFWLPESPQYLITRNRKQEAVNALLKLRGDTRENTEKRVDALYKIVESNKGKKRGLAILRTSLFCKGLSIIIGLFTIQSLCGLTAIVGYNAFILEEAGTGIEPNVASTIISTLQICGAVVGASTIDRLGRRKLLLTSCFCVFFSLSAFTVYSHVKTEELSEHCGWIPVVSLCLYIMSYAAGFGTVSFVLLPELFHPQARHYASGIAGAWISMMTFFVIKFFPIAVQSISLAGAFLIFTFASAFGFIFIYFVVFETRGKNTSDILLMLGGRHDDILENEVDPMILEDSKTIVLMKHDVNQNG